MVKTAKKMDEYRHHFKTREFVESLNEVEDEIRYAIKEGKRHVNIFYIIKNIEHVKTIIEILQNSGFKCKNFSFMYLVLLKISWYQLKE